MDPFGNLDDDGMMDVDPWLSVPNTSGFDDAQDAMFPSASPATSLPGGCPQQQIDGFYAAASHRELRIYALG